MPHLNLFQFNYRHAFRFSLVLNVVLVAATIVLFWHHPVSAATFYEIGSDQNSASYQLELDASDIIFVTCVEPAGVEAQLGYLSNSQAITCPG